MPPQLYYLDEEVNYHLKSHIYRQQNGREWQFQFIADFNVFQGDEVLTNHGSIQTEDFIKIDRFVMNSKSVRISLPIINSRTVNFFISRTIIIFLNFNFCHLRKKKILLFHSVGWKYTFRRQ